VLSSGRLFYEEVWPSAALLRVGSGPGGFPKSATDDRMILEVPADAGQVRHGGNAEPVELRTVAYSRKHQGLRGLDRTGRQHKPRWRI